MKQYNKSLRLLCAAVLLFAAAAGTFGGCTSVDDTLGGNLVPDNQQMRAGFIRLPESTSDKTKYLSTRLYQSDSIASSNLSSVMVPPISVSSDEHTVSLPSGLVELCGQSVLMQASSEL